MKIRKKPHAIVEAFFGGVIWVALFLAFFGVKHIGAWLGEIEAPSTPGWVSTVGTGLFLLGICWAAIYTLGVVFALLGRRR